MRPKPTSAFSPPPLGSWVSASRCRGEHAPLLSWVHSHDGGWEHVAARFGVRAERLEAARAWLGEIEDQGRALFPDVAADPAVLTEFVARFVADPAGVELLGLSLPAGQVEQFLAELAVLSGQRDGIVEYLETGRPPAAGGEPLGFEILAAHIGGIECSWVCNLLPQRTRPFQGSGTRCEALAVPPAPIRRWREPAGAPGRRIGCTAW
ncbi:MAG: hypothetical protein ACKVWR_03495 [Acidimicrobiales bacterium]